MSYFDMVPQRRGIRWLWAALLVALSPAIAFASPQVDESAPDLQPIKDYTLNQARLMQTATERLNQMAADYQTLLDRHGGNYNAAWKAEPAALRNLLVAGRAAWVDASTFYELSEGIIAGVPSLAFYDTWIDAGPSGAEDPAEAIDWALEVADGRVLDKPGNLFHHLTEPVLWGTVDEWTGARVDLDGDGQIAAVADALPETAILAAVSGAIDGAAAEMAEAVTAWNPTLPDVFTALVVMVPTMNEYFEQWKESRYVAGSASTGISFVAVSRLFDINGILAGLDLAYDHVSPLVAGADADLDSRIDDGFTQLVGYVSDLYEEERAGRQFGAAEADLFGTEAQELATTLSALLARAAELLEVRLDLA